MAEVIVENVKNNNANVSVGGGVLGGYFFSAPIGSRLPDSAWTVQADLERWGYVNTGYISEDGITDAIERSSDPLPDMNGTPMGSSRGSRTQTWALTWAEVKAAVLREIYGYGNVEDKDGQIVVHSNNKDQVHRSYVGLMTLKDDRPAVLVIPDGQCFVSGDLTINSTTLFGRQGTITGYGDEQGDTARWYIESTETTRPPTPSVMATGNCYGIDAADLGSFYFDGHTLKGTAKKQTSYTGFSSDPNKQEGYYVAFEVNPYEGVKFYTSTHPEKVFTFTEDDHFIVLFLGKDAPDNEKTFTIEDADGAKTTYHLDVTAED